MQAAASPRHPWKALAVVLLVLAVAHGARAHADLRSHDLMPIHVVHADSGCERVDIHLDDEGSDDDMNFEVFDDDTWS